MRVASLRSPPLLFAQLAGGLNKISAFNDAASKETAKFLKENRSALKRFCQANASLLASFTASSAHQKPISVSNTTSSVSPPKDENKKDESKKKRSMPVF